MFSLFQWTVNGDNGEDGHLARRHVEEVSRPQQGGFRNMSKMADAAAWKTHPEIGDATQTLAQV